MERIVKVGLTRGKIGLISAEDFELVSKYKWNAIKGGRTFYATTNIKQTNGKYKMVQMHRLILGAIPGQIVDHRNGNGLDNRRSNLRLASPTESACNIGLRKDNTSGHTGVFWNSKIRKWTACIQVNKRQVYLGCFLNKADAIRAREEAASSFYGEFASHLRNDARKIRREK